MNNDVTKYLKDCKKVFPFIGDKEKVFFKKFNGNVNDHFGQNENITYNELVEKLGAPKDIMISYIQDCEDGYIIHKMNLKKLMKQIFVIISVTLIIGLSIICYFEWKTIEESKEQNIITNDVIIEEN